jgi:BA14K-like protein
MSETPVERQSVSDTHRGEPIGAAGAGSGRASSRSREAGGAFLKALAADLGAVGSRFGRRLAAQHRPPQPPPAPPPSGIWPGFGITRGLWRLTKLLLAVLLLCSGALSAAMLWVIFGSPLEPGHRDRDTAPVAEAQIQPGPSPASAVEREKPPEATTAEAQPAQPQLQPTPTQPQPAQTQPQPAQTAMQDRSPPAGQPEISGKLTDQRPGMQCSVDLCAATYKSFNAADCTYQPYGGGPRSVCALGAPPVAAGPQSPRVAADQSPGAADTPSAAMQQWVRPDEAGPQCNQALCAATHRSFNAADCTYEPYGGGPRRICGP